MHQQDSADSLRFLVDHHIYDTMVVPACTFWPRYFNCAGSSHELAAVTLVEPILVLPGDRRDLEVLFGQPSPQGEREFEISSRPSAGGSWVRHCQGTVRPAQRNGTPA